MLGSFAAVGSNGKDSEQPMASNYIIYSLEYSNHQTRTVAARAIIDLFEIFLVSTRR